MKRWIFIFSFALIANSISIASANATGCAGGGWQFMSPNKCVIALSDQGLSQSINPTIDKCDDTMYGIKISTGYDYISYISITSIGLDGKLTPGALVNFDVQIRQACRAWKGAYKILATLISSDGTEIIAQMSAPKFRYNEKFTGTFDSYCFTNTCGDGTYPGTFALPINIPAGNFKISIIVSDDPSTSSITLPPVRNVMTFSGSLFNGTPTATPTPSPTATPTTDPNTINPSIPFTKVIFGAEPSGILACNSYDFTPSAVSSFGIIGTHWRFSTDNTAGEIVILDEFDMGLGVQTNGDSIRKTLTNGSNIALLINGDVFYGYSPRNQIKGAGYQCSVAVRTSSGIGRYATQIAFSTVDSKDFSVVTQPIPKTGSMKVISVTCVKGKSTKIVKGLNPQCPTGYKKAPKK
jgi:hypothetical protein